ncbi:MAG TPA: exosortase A [Duganella sp.]|uniref:exosortase A n=1 Tax=Duganella sp. TaxID=1904440 RepID=UPI002ED24E6A
MSADPVLLPSPVRRPRAKPGALSARTVAYACLAAALCAVLLIHYATAAAIVGVWLRSDTFAHGFVIPPIVGWMIWRRRRRLSTLPVRPAPAALLALAALGALWLPAQVANVQALQQYLFALMLVATVPAVLGAAHACALSYPLCYLLLAVPFGEILIPPLIEFTARCTVFLLQLTGIPVFRENNYLSLPSGNWSVVDACSGLRYLIASLALGAMYADMTYRSARRRLLFIAVSAVVPVFANALRAFTIVLIGHWSNMTLAIGIDHLVYGWVFFGLVSALLFWIGARWRDIDDAETNAAPPAAPAPAPVPGVSARLAPSRPAGFVRMALAVAAVTAIWPLLAQLALRPGPPDTDPPAPLVVAPPPAPWHAAPMGDTDWQARHLGQPRQWSANYDDGRRTVSLQLTWYRHQTRRSELLAPVRRDVAPGLPRWSEIGAVQRDIAVGGRALAVRQSIEQAAGVKLLVWRWYRQDGIDTASPQLLKLMLAKSKLLGGDDGGAEIVLASAYDDDSAGAERAMHDLLLAMLPTIDQGLRDAAR